MKSGISKTLIFAGICHERQASYHTDQPLVCRFEPYSEGPKYAGQAAAAISHPPPPNGYDEPFSIFMKRLNSKDLLLGWEYCGKYTVIEIIGRVQP